MFKIKLQEKKNEGTGPVFQNITQWKQDQTGINFIGQFKRLMAF